MTASPNVLAHLEWLGYVQPVGLVVSAQALDTTGAVLNRNDVEGQRLLERCTTERRDGTDVSRVLTSFEDYARTALGWSFHPNGFVGTAVAPVPDDLVVALPDEGGTLAPRFAVRDPAPAEGASPYQLVVLEFPGGVDLDRPWVATGRYDASPSSRLERLLRETGVLAGIACNGATIRLLVAPRGESSGWIDFRVDHMVTPAGRDIAAAARMLLNQQRLITGDPAQGLLALVRASRAYQSNVSERLAGQVLGALYELVRGAQAARSARAGDPIATLVAPTPPGPDAERAGTEALYQGLLTVVMRLLFQLYAEERGLAFDDGTPSGDYAVAPLYERLREDAALYPDTMDDRYGAWAQLLALWRLTYVGAPDLGAMPRHGSLFDPGRFPFLEGRHTDADPIVVPLIPDGTIHRVLGQLLVLDGERLSYRALDVEHIGSVYEAMMGFRIEVATGTSVAIRGQGALGAPVTFALEDLLAQAPASRAPWLEKTAGRAPTGAALTALHAARTIDEAHVALERLIDRRATPDRVPAGALVMQPSDERRSSGSHYTPRSLTEPIVKRTLDPQLDRLRPAPGVSPTPGAILGLAVCDPAMGSGAFLVETCRYLGDALVAAWHAHGGHPTGASRHDEVVHARRLVAQRCVYGVDRNRMAVELAKVSVWLATLARDLPLTFIDHALRHGDSLVGLTRAQVLAMDWDATSTQLSWMRDRSRDALDRLATARRHVRDAGVEAPRATLEAWWAEAGEALAEVRLCGNLVVMAFFAADPSARARATTLRTVTEAMQDGRVQEARAAVARATHGPVALVPFHWEVEFPEVFDRPRGGFDAFVGNPPFMGGRNLSANAGETYCAWTIASHEGSSGGADLIAHFFRRAFGLLRPGGTLGLIATNTVAQGDTRASGLRWICTHGGDIYHATRRLPWPGMAAVIVSVVHVSRGPVSGGRILDGTPVEAISAFLVPGSMHDDPSRLAANAGKSFEGSYVLGMGFTFEADATDDVGDGPPGTPTSIRRMEELLVAHPHYREVVMPYIGGEEVNSSPTHAHDRFVINFGERTEKECWDRYPDLMAIVKAKVWPERRDKDAAKYPRMVHEWWKYFNARPALNAAIAGLDRVLVIARVSNAFGLTFLPAGVVMNEKVVVFPFGGSSSFASLQSRVHEGWARVFSSSLKDDLQYTPSDCFETFPFPEGWEARADLEAVGQACYEFRASLMVANDEGLTKTYNRFHDPDERDPRIARLRELHAEMDRAVLDAYGWHDVPVACEFIEENPAADGDATPATGRARRRKYRYRWPDAVREDVLARLLELNRVRAEAERLAGPGTSGPARARGRPRGAGGAGQAPLF